MKLAEARANFERQYGGAHVELLDLVRRLATPQRFDEWEFQRPVSCPACASPGVASGLYDVEWDEERDDDGVPRSGGTLWFSADGFACHVCGLELGSAAELKAAGLKPPWDDGHVDPSEYERYFDEDAAYEARREQHLERD